MANVTPNFGSITPSQKQQALNTNYLNFTDPNAVNQDFVTFAQQYLPEIYEAEVERYGNRTLSGFLRMVGAEMPMTSDQVIWSEQNRLHIAYTGVDVVSAAANTLLIPVNLTPANPKDFVQNVISINQTIVIMNPATGLEVKAIVTASNITTGALTVAPYTAATLAAAGFTDAFFETGLQIWDVAAGSLLVTEAGGLVGNFTGEADFLEQKECLAGTPKIYGQLVPILSKYSKFASAGEKAAMRAADIKDTQARQTSTDSPI